MNEQDLRILITLRKCSSISRAGELLFISQPALTRRIHQIESEYHTKILIRSSHGIEITPQGEMLANFAEEILQRTTQIKAQVREDADYAGIIRIALFRNWWYDHFSDPMISEIKVNNGNIGSELIKSGLGYALFVEANYWMNFPGLYYRRMFYGNGTPVTRSSYLCCRKEVARQRTIRAFIEFTLSYAENYQHRFDALRDQSF